MNKHSGTDRRSFLKSGALLATPVALAAPMAAVADDGSRARLARLEDERAIEALHRAFVRRVSAQGPASAGEYLAHEKACKIDTRVCGIAEDSASDLALEIGEDGLSATTRQLCRVELETEFRGNTTLEQMARLQGQGSHRHSEMRVLQTDYIKGKNGWAIETVRFG